MRQVFYYKMWQFYYKMRQLFQIVTILLQNPTFITNCDSTMINADVSVKKVMYVKRIMFGILPNGIVKMGNI